MARYTHVLVVLVLSLPGCFSADDPPAGVAAGECVPDGDLCSVNGDCCLFDGSSHRGAALCVSFEDVAECSGT
ncbi:MAG: hypothetical protein ACRBN8_09410 [Nannocystales bacterium]